MYRRSIVLLTLVAASSLAACADTVTAPASPSVAPRTHAAPGGATLGSCRGGWLSSTGRCG